MSVIDDLRTERIAINATGSLAISRLLKGREIASDFAAVYTIDRTTSASIRGATTRAPRGRGG